MGSYPTVSPLPAKALLKDDEQVSLPPVTEANSRGGFFSVALSVSRNNHHLAVAVIVAPFCGRIDGNGKARAEAAVIGRREHL